MMIKPLRSLAMGLPLVVPGLTFAQTLSPTVVATTGGTGTAGNMTLDWTLGEPMVTTLDNGQLVLTQGFHQPGGVFPSALPAPFITTWNTANTGTSGSTEITIPTTGAGYLYHVDWNNDGIYDQFNVTGSVSHDFGVPGTYTIRITGAFPRIFFNGAGDRLKLLSVDQWGATPWTSMAGAFKGCSNMNLTATDAPDLSLVTDLSECFMDCIALTADLDQWDVLGITTMTRLFRGCTLFNGDVTTWATDSVTDMSGMFQLAGTFNRDISGWNTSKVITMAAMFANADSFDQPIGVWDVGQVQFFNIMFILNDAFDQPLNDWDVHSAVNFFAMFSQATAFNQPLDQWTFGAVNLSTMFSAATAFDQDLGAWDISQVTSFGNTLINCGMSTANYDATLIGWSTLDAGETQIPVNKTFGATGLTYCLGEAARNALTGTYGWTINDAGLDPNCLSPGHFVTTWKTDQFGGSSDPSSIIISTFPGETYNYDVDWNNDGVFDDLGVTGDITHDYGSPDTVTIRIRGTFPRIFFGGGGDKRKLLSVDQWGSFAWTSMFRAFHDCENLTTIPSAPPDLSACVSMRRMFEGCSNFNADLSMWDVGQVTDMASMFNSSSFNQDIGGWNVANVTSMQAMFSHSPFDQDISAWNVAQVTMMDDMFRVTPFDQDISSWNVGAVIDMSNMFAGSLFNQDIGSWNVSNATDMYGMFADSPFNQDISGWNVSNVQYMDFMFEGSPFNQDIGSWNTSAVTDMGHMFEGSPFNQGIGSWNTGAVTDMGYMFQGSPFDQDISSWNESAVTDMANMFNGATSFDQDLGGWDVSNVTNMTNMFTGAALSTANYDNLLIGWAAQPLQNGVVFSGGNSNYCAGAAARQSIIDNHAWTITDAGLDPGCAGVSLALRAFLQGPYDSGTGLMNDGLRANGLVPLSEPYTALGYAFVGGGGESTTQPILDFPGSNAIIDWVLVELRDKNDNTSILHSRAALLQADGDVVDVDGFSPVSFGVASDSYFISIIHRNHLGVMTLAPVALTSTAASVDFTDGSTATYGTEAQQVIAGTYLLWAGDITFDGDLKYVGQDNDRDPILVAIGGTVPTNVLTGEYRAEDVNLDGEVKYVGTDNDRDPILVNVGGTVPTNTRQAQLP